MAEKRKPKKRPAKRGPYRKRDRQPAIVQLLATRLKAVREKANLTPKALEVLLGGALSDQTIADIEQGKTSPTVATVAILAEALGVPLSELFLPEFEWLKR